MRFNFIEGAGWIGLQAPFAVDFTKLRGKVIGLVGTNGAGKTSFCELLVGGIYRNMPTRGSLVNFARDQDAYVKVGMTNGQDYTFTQKVRHSASGKTRKVEALVVGEDGEPLVKSAKIDEYRDWAAEHLPAPSVIFASLFAAQESNGFVDLDRAERMGVLLRVLGIERYEVMSSSAGKRAAKIADQLSLNEIRLHDFGALALVSGNEALALAENEVIAKAQSLAQDEKTLLNARAVADELKAKAEAVRAEIAENNLMREAITSAAARVADLELRSNSLEARIETYQNILSEAQQIEANKQKVTSLTAEIATMTDAIRVLTTQRNQSETAVQYTEEKIQTLQNSIDERQARLDEAVAKLQSKAAAEKAKSELIEAQTALLVVEREIAVAQKDKDRLEEKRFDDAGARSLRLRGNLETIATNFNVEPRQFAIEAVQADDQQLNEQAATPGLLIDARDRLIVAQKAEREARSKVESLKTEAAKLSEMDRAAETEKIERAAIKRLEKERATLEANIKTLKITMAQYGRDCEHKTTAQLGLVAALKDLGDVEAKATALLTAQASVSELKRELGETSAQLKQAQRTQKALPEPPTDPPLPDESIAAETVREAEQIFLEARLEHTQSRKNLEDTKIRLVKLDELRKTITQQKDELAQWRRLHLELGRDGLQAMEIDAAGPILTDLINDLLHTCFGSRWTVRVKVGADEGKVRESVDILVDDAETGTEEVEIQFKSGGERAILGEACSLALAEMACKRAGVKNPTLIRDESGAALDARYEDYATQYIAMLRRAAEVVGAEKVLFVSHGPEVQLADSWLRFRKGQITVCDTWAEASA